VECLEAIRLNDTQEVLVIDGGSQDDTVELARQAGVLVIEAGPVGLAKQRRIGYQETQMEYVAFVDADDRIEPGWIQNLLEQLNTGGYAALQSLLRVPPPKNFWTSGWDRYFEQTIQPAADVIMVGRPALYRTEALRTITSHPSMTIEDTEMSRELQLKGFRQGIGTTVSYRYCPNSASENFSKWKSYGRGYRQFIHANPDRRTAILRHITWTIPVARTWRPFLRGHLTQPIFGALMAVNVLIGFARG